MQPIGRIGGKTRLDIEIGFSITSQKFKSLNVFNGLQKVKSIKNYIPLTSQKSFFKIYELFVIGRHFQAIKATLNSDFPPQA